MSADPQSWSWVQSSGPPCVHTGLLPEMDPDLMTQAIGEPDLMTQAIGDRDLMTQTVGDPDLMNTGSR